MIQGSVQLNCTYALKNEPVTFVDEGYFLNPTVTSKCLCSGAGCQASMLTEALRATQAKMGALELENKALRDLAGSAGLHVDGQGGRQGVASIELVEMTALMTSVNQHLPCIQADHQNQLASSHSTVQVRLHSSPAALGCRSSSCAALAR